MTVGKTANPMREPTTGRAATAKVRATVPRSIAA
jgi:hypothetical protein